MARLGDSVTATASAPARAAGHRSLGSSTGTTWTLVPAALLVGLAFVVPIAILMWRSVSDPSLGFDNYLEAFEDPTVVRIMGRTFRVALIVTALTLLLGYPYAYVMTKVRARARTAMLIVLLIPFWTSVMARSFAWIALLQNNGLVNSVLGSLGLPKVQLLGTETGVLIGMVQVLLPFTVLPLFASLRTIDRSLMNAAEGLGATRVQAFRLVYLPLSVPGIFAAGLLTFVLSLGFYITPDLLGSPSNSLISQLIATRVSTLLDFSSAGALAALLLLTTLIVLAVSSRITQRLVSNATKDK